MKIKRKRLLHRIAVGLLAIITATGTLVVTSAAPASADVWTSWGYVWSVNGPGCLATDYSTKVYEFTACNGPQQWTIQELDAYPNTFVIHNQATGYCLFQLDYTHVISKPGCDGSNIGFRWWQTLVYDDGGGEIYIRSANTGDWLHTNPTTNAVDLKGSLDDYDVWEHTGV